ncbi:hypothetical protein JTB14_017697 [Gonioctena quinquepunctata]|nr:hypothetical protein JTB14_017697 [Gonioctena quinquepunctata]
MVVDTKEWLAKKTIEKEPKQNKQNEQNEKNWPQILAIVIACLAPLGNGLLYAWSSPFLPKITKDKENYDITENEASHFNTIQPLTMIVCCNLFSKLCDIIGRKRTLLLIAVPHIIAWILQAVARTVYVFYAARICAGISDAILFSTLPIYIGEIASPRVRGTWGNGLVTTMMTGQLLINVIGSSFDVVQTSYICISVPIVFFILFSLMPESPYFYIMQNRDEDAKHVLRFLKRRQDVDFDLFVLKMDVERQMSESGTWRDLLTTKSNRKALISGIFLRTSQQLSGMTVFLMYTQYIFEKSGGDISSELASIIFLGLSLILNLLVVVFIVHRLGRRISYVISAIPCAVVLLALSIYFYLDQYCPNVNVAFLNWVPITGMISYQIFSSVGLSVIPTLMLGELYSASVKSKAMAVLMIIFGCAVFISNNVFYFLNSYIGLYAPFLFFAICTSISALLSFVLIPETKDAKCNRQLPDLQELSISGNRIKYIEGGLLQKTPDLTLLELKGNPLTGVDIHAFSFLPRLRSLILSDARELSTFPNLNGTSALEILRLDRAGITSVPTSLCSTCPRLKSLDLKSNRLQVIPDLNDCRDMRVLDLASNNIRSIDARPFRGMSLMHDLLLAHNQIQFIPNDAFFNLSKLQVLDLEDNEISFIYPDSFMSVANLEDLNLGNNIFSHLPSAGLERLLHLKTFNNPNLREFPPPTDFPRIQTLVLAYAYHCCAFLPLIPSNPPPAKAKDMILFPDIDDIDINLWNSNVDIWPSQQNISQKFGKKFGEIWKNIHTDFNYPSNFSSYMDEYSAEEDPSLLIFEESSTISTGKIQCLPLPGPFLPCQDLFDWWTLRCGVWIVFLCAMLGNGTVVFVLIFSRSKMDVPRFLVCNLAAADFFMGIYLGFLAVVDASTLGEFRMYAIPWQMSAGCQLSGFLGVLSSELSVWTLAVITLERNYAITHAMHLNKRLSLKHAGYIMICGGVCNSHGHHADLQHFRL